MGDEQTGWRAHGERAIYDSPWVWLGQVDVELPDGQRIWHHVVRLRRGRDPHRVGEPTDRTESERLAWIPLASVPGLIAAGQIWTSGSLVGLLHFQAVTSSPGTA